MGHQEDFFELAKQEALQVPRTVAILMQQTRRHNLAYESAASILTMMQLDRAAHEAEEGLQAHTSHTECHLRLVGSEEVGTEYIDYGDSDDAA